MCDVRGNLTNDGASGKQSSIALQLWRALSIDLRLFATVSVFSERSRYINASLCLPKRSSAIPANEAKALRARCVFVCFVGVHMRNTRVINGAKRERETRQTEG